MNNIRPYKAEDFIPTAELIAKFRVELASFKGKEKKPDLNAAKDELESYLKSNLTNYKIWVAICNENKIVGYSICKVCDDVVWAESVYIKPDFRRNGIASAFFKLGEDLARNYGNETLYVWIHPNNDKIIGFLQKMGYTVLNLIEVRKKRKDEQLRMKIDINGHKYDY